MSRVAQRPHPRQRIAAPLSTSDVATSFRPVMAEAQSMDESAEEGRAGPGAVSRDIDPCLLALLETAAEWRCRLQAELQGIGLSAVEYSVLRQLIEGDRAMTVTELSASSPHVETCTAAAVESLAARALVEWQPETRAEGVPRARRVRVTERGRERQGEGACVVDAVSAAFAAAMPSAGRLILDRLASSLTRAA